MASPPARLPDSPLGEPGTHVDHLASRTRRAFVILPSQTTEGMKPIEMHLTRCPISSEEGGWSVRYFSVPTVFLLFFINPMLPGVGLLFAGLFCLQRYLRERGGAWLLLSALLLVALIEVKVFTAVHVMCSLGFAAVVYLLLFRNADLFKVAALTAALAVPLVLSLFLHNKIGADITTTFDLWLYVSA